MGLEIKRGFTSKYKKIVATSIAVFALIAQPLLSTNIPEAFAASTTVEVRNQLELVNAAADASVKVISVKASFDTSEKIVFANRNIYIDGNKNKINFTSDQAGWQGNYVLQAYKISLGIKNLSLTGGDAALYVNGSKVNLEGTVNVSGNEFGGIEVSQGGGVTMPAVLNAGSALTNTTEAQAKPSVWIDKSSIVNATVNGPFMETTYFGSDQKQYYLKDTSAPTIAINDIKVASSKLNFDIKATDGISGLGIIAANIYDGTNTNKVKSLGSKSNGQPGAVNDTTRLNIPYSGLPLNTFEQVYSLRDIDVSDLTDGIYTIRVYAKDRVGNENKYQLMQFVIDTVNPTAPQITAPSPNQEFEGMPMKIRATWNASTDDSGVISWYQIEYTYTRNGVLIIDSREVNGSQLYRDQELSGKVYSDFTIRVRAQDGANNWSDWSDPVTYYYGVDAPVIPPTDPVDPVDPTDPPVDPVDPDDGTNEPTTNPEGPSTGTPGISNGGSTIENDGGDDDGNNEEEDASDTSQQLAQLFIPGSAIILGVQDQNDDSNANGGTPLETVDEDVLGTTAEPKVASTSELGFMGLAWYWWLIILATLVGLWWLIAAARRRGASEQ